MRYAVTVTASYVLEIEAESREGAAALALEEVATVAPEWEVTDAMEKA